MPQGIYKHKKGHKLPKKWSENISKGKLASHYKHSIVTKEKISRSRKGKGFHDAEWKRKMSLSLSGSKNPTWQGNNPTYSALHMWLRSTYGNADHCENSLCPGKSAKFEWALIKGKKYKRSRKNFMKLCIGCHRNYDGNLPINRYIAKLNKIV